ncbi:ParB/RepB/Spo0J family partition protein [Sinorhizobium meliloti]|uniref:ParB/RepB/Spo0J family partition protein n=1 Tax=Rhizobium meliloti TaxID=382 RepID=UPI000FD8E1DF|nr:ParB N-terminal domain-containing protein [Sinorhizobium meliloti]RVN04071.1 hypothetical protein CN112_26055 [Sinorhizobium meliloti]
MTQDRLRTVELSKIHLRDDVVRRAISNEAVNELVESIKINGLITPIRVRPISKYLSGVRTDAWELIAGQHRVEAAKRLGWVEIDANTEDMDDTTAEMAMIDENLRRKECTAAELSYQTARRKELYELLFPTTANGGDRRSTSSQLLRSENEVERFTLNTAKATGKSERAVQMAASIGKKLGKSALDLVGTSLDSITELDALAGIKDDAVRNDLIDRAIAGEDVSAKSVKKPKNSAMQMDVIPKKEPVRVAAEAAADDRFFRKEFVIPSDPPKSHVIPSDDVSELEEVSLNSPMADISRVAGEKAVADALAAFDDFLGRFAFLTAEQKAECLSRRDLGVIIKIYNETKARA